MIYCADGFHGGLAVYPCALDTLMSRLSGIHEKYPRYRFYLELDGYAFEDMRRNPGAAKGIIAQGLEETWIELVNGAYTQPFCEAIGLESNILQLQWGKQLAREVFNVEITTYLIQEHAFHAALPQILNGLGYDLVVLRTHWPIFGQHPAFDKEAIHWQGLDGSSILTIPQYAFCHFGRVPEHYPALRSWLADSGWRAPKEEHIDKWLKECAGLGIDHPLATRLPDFVNGGIFPESVVDAMLDDPRLSFVLPKQYGRMLREETTRERPTEAIDPDSMDTHLPYGLHGDRMIAACKQLESRLVTLGGLSSFVYLLSGRKSSGDGFSFGGPNQYADDLRFAWKRLMLAQQHDIWVCGSSSRGGYSLERRGAAWIREASILCDGIEKECMMQLLYSQKPSDHNNMVRLVVYNPVSWQRSDFVKVMVKLPVGIYHEAGIVDADLQPVSCQVIDTVRDTAGALSEMTIAFIARNVPSCGYQTYFVVDHAQKALSALSADDSLIANGVFTMRISPRGIVSLVMTKDNIEIIDSPQGAARLVASRGDTGEVVDTGAGLAQCSCIERGPVFARYALRGTNNLFSFCKMVTVYDNLPRIDIEDTVTVHSQSYIGHHTDEPPLQSVKDRSRFVGWHTDAFIDSEKLRAVFPVRCSDCTVRRNVVYAGVQTRRTAFTAFDWADISDNQAGLSLINKGNLRYLYDPQKAELSLVLGYSGTYVFSAGPEYHAMRGEYRFGYSLFPHGAFDPIAINHRAQEANNEMLVEYWNGGPLKPKQHRAADSDQKKRGIREARLFSHTSFLRINDCSVEVKSVALVNERLLIRLCETAGKKANAVLTFFRNVENAQVVGMDGRELSANQLSLAVQKNQVEFEVHAFSIVCIQATLSQ